MTNVVWVYYYNNYSPNDFIKIFEIYLYTYTGFQTEFSRLLLKSGTPILKTGYQIWYPYA